MRSLLLLDVLNGHDLSAMDISNLNVNHAVMIVKQKCAHGSLFPEPDKFRIGPPFVSQTLRPATLSAPIWLHHRSHRSVDNYFQMNFHVLWSIIRVFRHQLGRRESSFCFTMVNI